MSLHSPPIYSYLPSFVQAGDMVLRRWYTAIVSVPRIQLVGTTLFFGAISFFVIALSTFLFSFPSHIVVAQGYVRSAPVEMAGVLHLSSEVHIAKNGLVLVRSAQVVAVQGTTLTISAAWESANFRWTVLTNGSMYENHIFGTSFLNFDGHSSTLQNIHVGDFVTVTGTLTAAQDPTLMANSVRKLEE